MQTPKLSRRELLATGGATLAGLALLNARFVSAAAPLQDAAEVLPWLDQSPVKSIRYKGPMTKAALALFVISFFVLGYLGTLSVTEGRTLTAQFFTLVYFAFFLLMPWYTRLDRTFPEPERVSG